MGKQYNSNKEPFFFNSEVNKRIYWPKNTILKDRLRTIIKSKGMSEADFYNRIGLTKQYWYFISWGIWECPGDLKVKIASTLDVDSSVIFEGIKVPEFVTADKYSQVENKEPKEVKKDVSNNSNTL